MTLWEVEMFLNQTSDTPRSLADPWELDGTTNFDKEVLLNTILLKGGELGPMFNNVATFYKMNMYWWKKWQPTFQKWWEVECKDYEPLWDRNGFEEVHDDTTDTGTSAQTTANTQVVDGSSRDTKTSTEVIDDDTTGSKTSEQTLDKDTTDRTVLSSTEVLDGETSGRRSLSETTHEEVESDTTDDKTEQHSGRVTTHSSSDRNVDVENKTSAYDSATYEPESTTHTDDVLVSEDGYTEDTVKIKTDDVVHAESESNGTKTDTETTSGTTDNTTTVNSTTTGTGTEDSTVEYTENTTGTDDRTTTYTETGTGKNDVETTFDGQIDGTTSNDRDFDHALHSWGNWGISQTSQKLYESEFKLRYQMNPYELMSDMYLKEMTDGVWL